MSYWGCGSRRNQALWLLVVWCGATGLCLLGTALGLDLGCNLYWDYEHRDCYMSHNYYYSYAYYNVCAQSGSVRFLAAGSVLIGAGLAGLIATRLAHAHCHDPVDRDPAAAAGSPYGAAPTQAAGPAASDSSVGDTDTGRGTGTGAEEQARSSLPGPAAHAGVQPAEAGHRCCHGGRCTWRAVRPSEGLAWFASGACILAGSCLLCLGGAERACLDDYVSAGFGTRLG
ncbi:hypothetical protein HYH03_003958 [Edaphochlamys debaryana]|uniref:Uncharacterized protein n=1 Tax=Edaphochlamys debaryana TaxID=47281 RepID=A0A836C2N2_9CHLO|nr:hypothetical protein HYH03_003958 [Edaphochlamys debaryana]|eukprot:KAG2498206.1 hypothetical protein HYH03_003958 [Edaphochlamys debaryana]